MKRISLMAAVFVLLLTLVLTFSTARAQGTAFMYQGQLTSNGSPANGLYDFRFKLASDPLANNYVGGDYLTNGIPVTNGLFITTIDFGPGIFTGSNYWLEVDVRTNNPGNTLAYTTLNPLQAVTPVPYAIFANSASNLLGSVASANLSGTYGNSVTLNNAGNNFTGNGSGLTSVNAGALNGLNATNFWQTGGNAGTAPGVNFLGTIDNQPLEIYADGSRALRIEPGDADIAYGYPLIPNIIGGSPVNFASGQYGVVGATIAGGGAALDPSTDGAATNSVNSDFGTVGGGAGNTAGYYSTVGGGFFNSATGTEYGSATASGGDENNAGGDYATVPGGYDNTASGEYSFAAGDGAQAVHQGAFVWADSQGGTFASTANNQFLVRAEGGVGVNTTSPQQALSIVGGMNIDQGSQNIGTSVNALTFGSGSGEGMGSVRTNGFGDSFGLNFYTDFNKRMTILQDGHVGIGTTNATQLLVVGSGGAYCNGTTWVNGSDRNSKQDFATVNPVAVLDKISAMPITEWQYKVDASGIKHIGPMAQDFHAAFGLNGPDDKHISTVDESGVALAAIQGLNEKLEARSQELESRNQSQSAEITALKQQNDSLAERLNELEQTVQLLAKQK